MIIFYWVLQMKLCSLIPTFRDDDSILSDIEHRNLTFLKE